MQEESKSEEEKLVADVTTLVCSHMRRQKERVSTLFPHLSVNTFCSSESGLMVKHIGKCKTYQPQRNCHWEQNISGWTCFLNGGDHNRCQKEVAYICDASRNEGQR